MDPLNTRFGNLQIYSILEHIIPNFMTQQRRALKNSTHLQRKATIFSGPKETKELKIYKSTAFWSMINQTFGLSKEISYQKSTNLQRKGTICSRTWDDQNWKSKNLQYFGAWSTKLLGIAKKNISRIYKSTEKSDHMFQTLWRLDLKIYKSTAFWSMINQTFGLR